MPFNLGLGLGIQRGGYMFSPASLFTASEPGVIYDASDINTLFQDTAGTQPVTAVGQAVARINDKSGRGNHATQSILASRPTYALHPSSGIRNLANGSADVGNAAYWPASITSNGVTATKLGAGIDTDGLPYVDYSIVGTATSTSFCDLYAIGSSRIAASTGQTFTTSTIAQITSGTVPPAGCGAVVAVYEETAPTTVVATTASSQFASTTQGIVTVTYTLVNASTNQARGGMYIRTASGATVNYTIRIKALQFELGSARTNYQFNYANFNIVEAPFAQVGNLLFDGIDDFLVTPTITPNTDKVQVFAGVRKLSDAARGIVVELGAGPVSNSCGLEAPPNAASGAYRMNSGGTVTNAGQGVAFAGAPDTAVLAGSADIAADLARLRRNGVVGTDGTADQGTGIYGNQPLYIGRRGGTSLPFNGRLYGLVVRFGPNLDAATIAATEAWMNVRTGAY